MASAANLSLMTVEEYRELPDRHDVIQELHFGQVVTLSFPKMGHSKLQRRLLQLLQPLAESKGVVAAELPFRALVEYDLRAADVAFVSQGRWDATEEDDNLHGSPELVIEVLSASNTKSEIREKAALCLSAGAEEFWVVDPKRKTITVTRRSGETAVHRVGDRIPLQLFAAELKVSDVFV